MPNVSGAAPVSAGRRSEELYTLDGRCSKPPMATGYTSHVPADRIAERVSSLGDWITGFVINGTRYGGQYVPELDERVLKFVARLKARSHPPTDILECGCLEGGHTVVMAKAFPQARIHAVDVRPENLAKTRAIMETVGVTNVSYLQDDFEAPQVSFSRKYDAIFCVGLLYHLRDPREFLRKASAAAPVLWLWTVYCAEAEVAKIEGEARGRILHEHTAHPLSAVRGESYLPTLGSLADYLWEAGYTNVELIRKEMTANGNGPAILLCASR